MSYCLASSALFIRINALGYRRRITIIIRLCFMVLMFWVYVFCVLPVRCNKR